MTSSWLPLSLLTSFPMHLTLFSVCFPTAALSPSWFLWLFKSCFVSFSRCSHLSFIFCFLALFWSSLVSHLLCPDRLPHLPSSDLSGPETPSFSAHHPLPPPKVLTLRHTALCAAVHTLGLRRGLIAKGCLCPGSALMVWLGEFKGCGRVGRDWAFFLPVEQLYCAPPL